MIKKWISLILSLILAISILGCDSNKVVSKKIVAKVPVAENIVNNKSALNDLEDSKLKESSSKLNLSKQLQEKKNIDSSENGHDNDKNKDSEVIISKAKTNLASMVTSEKFRVDFIDVGQADSAIITCDNESMLVDGGNVSDANKIYTYLKKRKISKLKYIIATHAHEDHVGGIPAAFKVCKVEKIYSPVATYNSKAFKNLVKAAKSQDLKLTKPKVGEILKLGSATIEILAPLKDYTKENTNNTSIVFRITYGKHSFMFTGDVERESENDILEHGYNNLKVDVLKVAHHGSSSSSSYPFLRALSPKYAVISCEKNNKYGHPHKETLSKLRDADVKVFRTDMQGDIVCLTNGKNLKFLVSRNLNVLTNPLEKGEKNNQDKKDKKTEKDNTSNTTIINKLNTKQTKVNNSSVENNSKSVKNKELNSKNIKYQGIFIGNKNSKVLHTTTCKYLPLEKNRVFFNTHDEALKKGYKDHNCIK